MSYEKKVERMICQAYAEGKVKRGCAYIVNVAHDDWCDLLKGRGPCNCNPTIHLPEKVPNPEEN